MVSLSTPRSTGTLVQRLAASPRPALIQEATPDGGSGRPAAGASHGAVAQRMELSGAVTVNWAAKAAGLLAEEGVAAADTVVLDLPEHWMSHALALGALCAGAELAAGGPDSPAADASPAAVLTDRPEAWTDPGTAVLAVALPGGLAPVLGWAGLAGHGDLDPGVVDVAAEIRAQPDALPGPLAHVTPEAVPADDDGAARAGDAVVPESATSDGRRPRITLSRVQESLRAWDAGQAFSVPA